MVAPRVVDAFAVLRAGRVSVALINHAHPELDGLSICRCLRNTAQFGKLPLLLYGGGSEVHAQAQKGGVNRCFPSLSDLDAIVQAVAHLLLTVPQAPAGQT